MLEILPVTVNRCYAGAAPRRAAPHAHAHNAAPLLDGAANGDNGPKAAKRIKIEGLLTFVNGLSSSVMRNSREDV